MLLKTNERVFVSGKTGSGKTYLMRYMTRNINRLVILDGKAVIKDWNTEPLTRDAVRKLRRGQDARIRVVPPINKNAAAYFDTVLEDIFQIGNVTVYIDELYSVVPPNQQASNILWACYTRGREYGIGLWACTQRPVWIPLVAISEAEHYFLFRLSLVEDRQRMAAFMGREVLNTIKDTHGFFYMRAEDETPQYYKKLTIKGNGKTPEVKEAVNNVSRLGRRQAISG